jgi:hypothetical protein
MDATLTLDEIDQHVSAIFDINVAATHCIRPCWGSFFRFPWPREPVVRLLALPIPTDPPPPAPTLRQRTCADELRGGGCAGELTDR